MSSNADQTEKWLAIDDYPEYEVSSLGRVKRVVGSKGACKNRILRLTTNRRGRVRVALCRKSRAWTKEVHRLVATAFVPGYFEGAEVNHIDEDPKNNTAANLEWVTGSANKRHSAHKFDGRNPKRRVKLTPEKVQSIRATYAVGEHSQKELARAFGVAQMTISRIVRGERWGYLA